MTDGEFEELFTQHRQAVWAFFARRLADRARAEELAQDVFLAVLKNAGRYRPDAPIRSYLFGIAFRMLAAERRKRGREGPAIDVAAPQHDADAVLFVRQALDRLSDSDREIVMLREFDQLSYDDIASVLEIPVNTVRSRLFRARMELHRWLSIPIPKP